MHPLPTTVQPVEVSSVRASTGGHHCGIVGEACVSTVAVRGVSIGRGFEEHLNERWAVGEGMVQDWVVSFGSAVNLVAGSGLRRAVHATVLSVGRRLSADAETAA